MTTWIVIAEEDLQDYLMAPQYSVLTTAVLAEGQSNPFTNIMQARANYVRNRIAGRVHLSATDYAVPPELKDQTCWLILEKMSVRIPVLKLSQDQRDQIARAYKDLDIAGTQEFPISTASDSEEPDVSAGTNPSFADKNLNYERADQDGV